MWSPRKIYVPIADMLQKKDNGKRTFFMPVMKTKVKKLKIVTESLWTIIKKKLVNA